MSTPHLPYVYNVRQWRGEFKPDNRSLIGARGGLVDFEPTKSLHEAEPLRSVGHSHLELEQRSSVM